MPDTAHSRIFTRYADGRMLYMPDDPVFAGGKSGSFLFERQQIPASGRLAAHTFDDHVFMLPVGDSAARFTSRLNGRSVQGLIEPWRFRFLAAGDTLSTSWDAPLDAIFVTLNPDILPHALGEDASAPTVELTSNILSHEDPLLTHLTQAMQSYLRADRSAGKIFEQSLLTAIAAHLVTAYGRGKRGAARNIGLSRQKRARVEDYVHQNLGRDIGLNDIASAVDMSPYRLTRAFKATTGQSPWQFVIECRVREATYMLARNDNLSLSYVARACGFESYSQFVAAFRKIFGQLPSEYRRARGG